MILVLKSFGRRNLKAYNSVLKPGSILLLILTLQQDEFRMPLNYNTTKKTMGENLNLLKSILG